MKKKREHFIEEEIIFRSGENDFVNIPKGSVVERERKSKPFH